MTNPPHSDGPDGGHPGSGQPAPEPWSSPEQASGQSPWDARPEDDAGPGATRPYGRPPFGAPQQGQPYGPPPYGPPPGQFPPPQPQHYGRPPYGQAPQGTPYSGPPQHGQAPHAATPYGRSAYGQPGYGQPPYGQPPQGGPGYGAPPPRSGSRSRTGLIVGLVALLALVVVGVVLALTTGPTALSRSAVEQDVAEQFEQREGVAVDLECAEEMAVEAGATYECTGVTADNEEVTLQIRITDEDGGRYTWSEP